MLCDVSLAPTSNGDLVLGIWIIFSRINMGIHQDSVSWETYIPKQLKLILNLLNPEKYQNYCIIYFRI